VGYKGVIFDLFHTLTGPESEWGSLPDTSKVLGVEQNAWNEALVEGSKWRLLGQERDALTIIRRLAHSIDPTIPEETIGEAKQIRTQRFRHSLQNIPQKNIETLKALRAEGLKLGLLSNADVSEIEGWSESPLCGSFHTEVFSCEVGHVKPEPEIYLKCLELIGLAPEECLFIGDGGSDELRGAQGVGLTPVFISGVIAELWPEVIPSRRALVEHEIREVPEVFSLLGLTRW
jgi:putative hydrolase of the HAD superfamily